MLESKFSNFQLLPTHSELQLGSFEGMPCKMLHKAGGSYALMQEKLEANLKPWWRLSQTLRQNLGVFGKRQWWRLIGGPELPPLHI